MRLLLASSVTDSQNTGMGKWTHRTAAALRAQGHDVTVWFGNDVPLTAPEVCKVFLYPVALMGLIVRRRASFDAVIVHEPGGFWYGLARLLWRSLPPIVAMCHNVETKWFGQWLASARAGFAVVPWATRVKAPLCRMWQSAGTILLADHVVCLSSEDRDYVINRLHRSAQHVTQTASGLRREDFAASGARRSGSMMFVGGWFDVKGIRLLPMAFTRVRRCHPHVTLTVVGSGASAERVLSHFSPADRAHVRVVEGTVGTDELRHLYLSHQVFFIPSLSEGSPLSLLEAMAAGCVAVGAAVGGIPDIVRDGKDGLLFEGHDVEAAAGRLSTVFGDPQLLSTLGRAASSRAQEFTWDQTALALQRAAAAAILSELISTPR